MAEPILSIVIANYNTAALVLQCLRSIYEVCPASILTEAIVVDNGSSDGSPAAVREAFPAAVVLENGQNLGFAVANNVGILHSRGRFVLLLNSDTIVTTGMIEGLLLYLEREPGVGAVGARVLNGDGTDQDYPINFPTIRQMLGRLLERRQIPWPRDGSATPMRVDRIMGACLMTRREVLDRVGLLDESFFMYDEDVDWCVRCAKAGWELRVLPDVYIYHLKGQTSGFRSLDHDTFNGQMFVELRRSRYRLYQKHAGWLQILALKVLTDGYLLGAIAATSLRRLLSGTARHNLRGRMSAYVQVLRLNPLRRECRQ